MDDPVFKHSKDCLDGLVKKLKPKGELCPVQHKDFISDEDFAKMKYKFLRCKEPAVLVMEVWFYVTYHFALHGREIQRQVKKSDLILKMDENGKEYFMLNVDLVTKNHPGGVGDRCDPPTAGRIQEPEQAFSVKFLLERLNPDQDVLFQNARSNMPKREKIWFQNVPLKKKTLAQIMPRLSKVCELSKV